MTPPRWIVPLEPGPDTGGPALLVVVDDELRVSVEQRHAPNGRLPLLASLTALHLGSAIQSAAVWAGQEKARREMRRSKR